MIKINFFSVKLFFIFLKIKRNNFANNEYANDQQFIIEEIEEKFEEQYEEHEELEEQEQKMINTFSKYQSDIRNKMNLKQN